MEQWITNIMQTLGYWGIGLLMFLENIVPPIPSEVIMPAAGFASRRGELNIWLAILAGTVGSLAGVTTWYYVARWIGPRRLRKLADRYGKWVTITSDDIDRAVAWFHRWGPAAVLLCRMVPGLRTLISVPAGFSEMALVPFLGYSLVGTVIWTALLAWIGWLLRANYDVLQNYIEPISIAVLVALFLWGLWWLIRRKRGVSKGD